VRNLTRRLARQREDPWQGYAATQTISEGAIEALQRVAGSTAPPVSAGARKPRR